MAQPLGTYPRLPPSRPSTPRTLTLRVLASIAATAVKTIDPIEIISGMIDTTGEGGGRFSEGFSAFPMIPSGLLQALPDDLFSVPEYRFWFVRRGDDLILPSSNAKVSFGIDTTTTPHP